MRINKFLSTSGICSRRKADEHILAGEVTINNKPAKLGDQVDPSSDIVQFNDKEVGKHDKNIYIALYKPKGVISTSSDEQGRRTVTDLLPKSPRVYPVGRLDQASEGLIILTNDGELTNTLTHPKYEHEKEYEVIANGIWKKFDKDNIINVFEKGLKIDGVMMRVDRVYNVKVNNDRLEFNIVMHTGHNRQIRKMCDKMGLSVKKLTRIRIGNLRLGSLNLRPGDNKKISKSEIL